MNIMVPDRASTHALLLNHGLKLIACESDCCRHPQHRRRVSGKVSGIYLLQPALHRWPKGYLGEPWDGHTTSNKQNACAASIHRGPNLFLKKHVGAGVDGTYSRVKSTFGLANTKKEPCGWFTQNYWLQPSRQPLRQRFV